MIAPDDDYGPAGDWRHPPAASAARRINVGDVAVNLIDLPGDGLPMLFLHGIGNTWRFWTGQLQGLAGLHRVVAFDLPGFGDSGMPAGDLTATIAGSMIAAACDQLGISRALIVGHSMGALAGLSLAADHPDLVAGVIAISPALSEVLKLHKGLPHVVGNLGLAARYGFALTAGATRLPSWMQSRITQGGAARQLALGTFVTRPDLLDPSVVEACLMGLGQPGVRAVARSAHKFDLEAVALRVRVPVLLVNGSEDRLSRLHSLSWLADRLRDCQTLILPWTGHWPMIERGPRVNGAIQEFVADLRES